MKKILKIITVAIVILVFVLSYVDIGFRNRPSITTTEQSSPSGGSPQIEDSKQKPVFSQTREIGQPSTNSNQPAPSSTEDNFLN